MNKTNSFLILKEHSQSVLDFSILVCTAAPQLKHTLEVSEKFAMYGITQVLKNRKLWKSADIPNLIKDSLIMDIEKSDRC